MKKGRHTFSAPANQQRAGSALRAALAAAVRARGIRNDESKADAWNTCSVTNSRGQYSLSQGKLDSRSIQINQSPILELSKVSDAQQDGGLLNIISSFSPASVVSFSPERITDDDRSSALTDRLSLAFRHFFSRKLALHYNNRRSFLYFHRWSRFVGESFDVYRTIERAERIFRKLLIGTYFGIWFEWRQYKRMKQRTCSHLEIRNSCFRKEGAWQAWLGSTNCKRNTSSTCMEYIVMERAERILRRLRIGTCFVRWLEWRKIKRAKRRICSRLDLRNGCSRKELVWHAWLGMINCLRDVSIQCEIARIMRQEAKSILADAISDTADLRQYTLNSRLKTAAPSASLGRDSQTIGKYYFPPEHDQPVEVTDMDSIQIIALEEKIYMEIETIEKILLLSIRDVELNFRVSCSIIEERESAWSKEKAAYESR
jgi:hypothetical protein